MTGTQPSRCPRLPGGAPTPLEGPDHYIALKRAAQISGVAPDSLRRRVYRGDLRAVKVGRAMMTTRRWLHQYLTNRDGSRDGHPASLPADYVPPE